MGTSFLENSEMSATLIRPEIASISAVVLEVGKRTASVAEFPAAAVTIPAPSAPVRHLPSGGGAASSAASAASEVGRRGISSRPPK